MIIYTSHVKPPLLPVLVPEGFSWGAALFGWLWLLVQGAWVPALLLLACVLAAGRLMTATGSIVPLAGLVLVQGVLGHDMLRWWLGMRGFQPEGPVAGLTHDAALLRLLQERPDLAAASSASRP